MSDGWHNNIGNNPEEWKEFVFNFHNEEWLKLSTEEKAIMRAYRNHLFKKTPVPDMKILMISVNEIHGKYPEFDIGCIP